MNYQRFFEDAIDQLHAERRYRVFADLERIAGRFPRAVWRANGRAEEITVWCSNDYLGMGQHPDVIAAMQQAAGGMGSGAGGTRNISGTNHPLVELEEELAGLHGKEAGLVFTSGFVSNEAAISTIARLLPNCLIVSDELNHASMIEGVRRSGAEKKIFRHNDVAHLESILQAAGRERAKLEVQLEANAKELKTTRSKNTKLEKEISSAKGQKLSDIQAQLDRLSALNEELQAKLDAAEADKTHYMQAVEGQKGKLRPLPPPADEGQP